MGPQIRRLVVSIEIQEHSTWSFSNQVELVTPNLNGLAVSVTEFIYTPHYFPESLQICYAVTCKVDPISPEIRGLTYFVDATGRQVAEEKFDWLWSLLIRKFDRDLWSSSEEDYKLLLNPLGE